MQKTYYHGTTSASLDGILKEGLIPGKGRGGSFWAFAEGMQSHDMSNLRMAAYDKVKRANDVYLAANEETARNFASFAWMVNNHSKPVIFQIELPATTKLTDDIALSKDGLIHDGPIPAVCIIGYKIGTGGRDGTPAEMFDWPKTFTGVSAPRLKATRSRRPVLQTA